MANHLLTIDGMPFIAHVHAPLMISAGHYRTGEALMAADSKAYLGSGWAFPVRPSSGALRYVRHEEDIEQAIQIILLTGQ